jgi:hypothetical protein
MSMMVNPARFAGAVDANWANVKALMGFEGADASTTFTDQSASPKTYTPNGNAQIDTAQFKFGAASGLFDGTGDFLTTPNHADFALSAAGDITVEAWIRLSAVGRIHTICCKRPAASANEWTFSVSSGNQLSLGLFSSGSSVGSAVSTGTIAVNTWTHVAGERHGTAIRTYLNGVLDGTGTQTGSPGSSSVTFNIGRSLFNTGRDFQGWIDEFRFTRAARYGGSNFTPPAAAFPRS